MSEIEGPPRSLVVTLATLTVIGGFLDAVSYLGLGHVFTANMTGTCPDGVRRGRSARLLGAGQSLCDRPLRCRCRGWRQGRSAGGIAPDNTRGEMTIEGFLISAGAVISACVTGIGGGWPRYAIIALLSFAMGMRNVSVRRMAVDGMTTTVLTTTLTGLISDSALAGGGSPNTFAAPSPCFACSPGRWRALPCSPRQPGWALGVAALLAFGAAGYWASGAAAAASRTLTARIDDVKRCRAGRTARRVHRPRWSAARSSSTMSASAACPTGSHPRRDRRGRRGSVRRPRSADPERKTVAGLEGLAITGIVRARHEVQAGPPVGWGQAHRVLAALYRHGRPAVRPHREREIRPGGAAGVLAVAVGDLHPVPVDPADGPLPDLRRVPSQRGAGPAGRAVCRGRRRSTPNTSAMVACRSTVVVSAAHSVPPRDAGPVHQQRDVAERLVLHDTRLAPDVLLAEVVPVVGAHDHCGAVPQVAVGQCREDLADPVVDHAELGAVVGPDVPPLALAQAPRRHRADVVGRPDEELALPVRVVAAAPTARACRTARAGRTRPRTSRNGASSAARRGAASRPPCRMVRGPGKSSSVRKNVRDRS